MTAKKIANNKTNEEKIEKMNMEINKYKSKIKEKEEDLLVYKLNDEKVLALNDQKINFLEKELSQWKERYNAQGKELSENKSEIISLNSEIDKLKTENKNLKSKIELGGGVLGKIEENLKGTGNNFFGGGGNSTGPVTGSSANSKILFELLNGQNAIKDYIKEVMDKTNELVENNKNIYENNVNISQFLKGIKGLSSNNINHTGSNKKHKKEILSDSLNKDKEIYSNYYSNQNKNDLDFNSIIDNNATTPTTNTNTSGNLHYSSKSNYNFEDYSINSNTLKNNSINTDMNKSLNIKVSNTVLKKDITGKPFLDYICEIKNGNKSYTLNKKFGHFIMLHKSLKLLFKDLIQLPDGGNLFISITDMKQNTFHENKLTQLDRYINDLLAIDQVKNSEPFKDFFELDEQHEQNNNKIRKNKTMIDNKRFSKYSSSNTLNKDTSDYSNSLINFK